MKNANKSTKDIFNVCAFIGAILGLYLLITYSIKYYYIKQIRIKNIENKSFQVSTFDMLKLSINDLIKINKL